MYYYLDVIFTLVIMRLGEAESLGTQAVNAPTVPAQNDRLELSIGAILIGKG